LFKLLWIQAAVSPLVKIDITVLYKNAPKATWIPLFQKWKQCHWPPEEDRWYLPIDALCYIGRMGGKLEAIHIERQKDIPSQVEEMSFFNLKAPAFHLEKP
jgi:hypothetical protein